jgi:hypothetical protein
LRHGKEQRQTIWTECPYVGPMLSSKLDLGFTDYFGAVIENLHKELFNKKGLPLHHQYCR